MSTTEKRALKITPDCNIDVLWRTPPVPLKDRERSLSTSSESGSITEGRRSSISQMFGINTNNFLMRRQSSISSDTDCPEKITSVTERKDFQELLRRQRHVLGSQ